MPLVNNENDGFHSHNCEFMYGTSRCAGAHAIAVSFPRHRPVRAPPYRYYEYNRSLELDLYVCYRYAITLEVVVSLGSAELSPSAGMHIPAGHSGFREECPTSPAREECPTSTARSALPDERIRPAMGERGDGDAPHHHRQQLPLRVWRAFSRPPTPSMMLL